MTSQHEFPFATSPETLDLLFRGARTANSFTDEPVSDEQIRALYELVKFGPTAMNLQSLRIVAVRSAEARERLVSHMGGNNKEKTAAAPLAVILAADTNFHEQLQRTFPHFEGAKAVYADDVRREATARHQAWLQIGYFIVGVRALGLAAGPMLGFNAAELDADFFAGTALKSICVVNIGKPGPDAWRDRLPRLPFDEVVTTV